MKKSRFTDSQIVALLKRAESGEAVPESCREAGISSVTFDPNRPPQLPENNHSSEANP